VRCSFAFFKGDMLKKNKLFHNWIFALLLQTALSILIGGALLYCSILLAAQLGYWVYAVYLWGFLPVWGLYSAYRATLGGLLNYAAWLPPPALMWLMHYLLCGYSPAAGAILLCAFTALVGAAAGEVRKQQRKKHKEHVAHG